MKGPVFYPSVAVLLSASQASALITTLDVNLDVTYTGIGDGTTTAYIDPFGSASVALGSNPSSGFILNASVNGSAPKFDFAKNSAGSSVGYAQTGANNGTPYLFGDGESISSHGSFSSSVVANTNNLGAAPLGEMVYLGIRSTDGGNAYGWVSLTITDNSWNGTSDQGISATIHEVAFGEIGDSISAAEGSMAAVPEPASAAALLALGAAGMAVYRRRRSV